ncbi:MerR family transcriptional regulator [Priestia megaterium]|uniref:MerR family transcriptional regulator n=1 Tax=Priestia megaterium TaxID=1404 RepID=UPI0035E21F3D
MSKWYTINELEEKTSIPHQTIRRYIDRHSQHFNIKRKYKSYLLSEDAVEVIHQIRTLYGKGMNAEQVDEELNTSGLPIEYVINDEKSMITMGSAFENMQESLQALHEKHEKQEEFNRQLIDSLQKQEKYIQNSIDRRDKQLTESIREQQDIKKMLLEIKESQKEIAAASQKENKKGWLQRLFSK